MRRATGILIIALALGCAGRVVPPRDGSLEKLRKDPSLAGPEGRAFVLLAAADDLRLRARGEWDHHQNERARRDATMGEIKMRTALAMWAGEFASSRVAQLDAELVDAQADDDRLGQALATVEEEIAIASRLRTMTAQVANERTTLRNTSKQPKSRPPPIGRS